MLKLKLSDVEKFAAEKKWPLYADDLLSAGILISHDDQTYLLIESETYQFFKNKYENFSWPNSISATAQ